MQYDNPPTVVVMLVPIIQHGLLLIRRALPDGRGKLALPGGFQVKPDTWQEAGAREVLEETGVVVDPFLIRQFGEVVTTPDRSVNLLFGIHDPVAHPGQFAHDHEIMEVLTTKEPVETAFPLHTQIVHKYFREINDGAW